MHADLDALLRYADGELNDSERLKLEGHLADCSECRIEADRLRSSITPAAVSGIDSGDLLSGIQHWAANRRPSPEELKESMAAEIVPYLGKAGCATVLERVASGGSDLLPTVEGILADFLGRRAVEPLVDRIVEHTIVRT